MKTFKEITESAKWQKGDEVKWPKEGTSVYQGGEIVKLTRTHAEVKKDNGETYKVALSKLKERW